MPSTTSQPDLREEWKKGKKSREAILRVLPETLLTAAETAARLGVNRETVYRLIARGALPAARVGSVLRVSPADFAAYLRGARAR